MLWQFPELDHLTQDLFAIDLHAVVDRPQRTSLDADALLDVTDTFHGILVLVFKVSERQAKVLAECRNIGVGILAEQVLLEMLDQDCQAKDEVCQQLMGLYEQERDWVNAISMGERLIKNRPALGPVLAQYCCEQAENLRRDGDINPARRMLRRALSFDEKCVRASFAEGELEMGEENWDAAIQALQRIWVQDSDFFDEALDKLRTSYQQQEKDEEFIQMLADYSAEKPSTSRILLLAETLKERYGDKEAADFIAEYMKANPSVRGLNRIIDMSLAGSAEGETREHLGVLKQLSEQLLNDKSLYKCRRCGFETPLMQWRCPSCKRWGSIKPVVKEV